jgi:carbamate kinase
VVEDGPRLIGREGVVDKDLAAAILARDVQASTLLILTDVQAVQRGFGTKRAEAIERMTAPEAREMLEAGEFGAGSMGPKVEAAVRFAEQVGGRSVIGDLDAAVAVLSGESGTSIVPN